MSSQLVIVDYGMGNLWSVFSAFSYLGVNTVVSNDPELIRNANLLVLPGVGSFRKAMDALKDRYLVEPLNDAILVKKTKILGICLGMQLFSGYGSEDGGAKGLNFIGGVANRFSASELGSCKLPHIGFNNVYFSSGSKLGQGLEPGSDFYFVHSYRMLKGDFHGEKSVCDYGIKFLAAYEHENIFATQFHPEKSQSNGLKLLTNFLSA